MTTHSDLATIIIVSYNSFYTIQKCMSAWLESSQFRIIIVDNASTDDSANRIFKNHPNIELIKEPINLGYGRAANRALERVQTPYAILLNPDLMANEKNINALVERASSLGNDFSILAPAVTVKDYSQEGLITRNWVIGAAMLFNMANLRQTGFFDENIFLFSEETDLCRRVKNRGQAIYLDSDLYIEHLLNQSSAPSQEVENLKNWHTGWSRSYYRNKHGLNNGKHSNWRVALKYGLKWLLATRTASRLKYKNRFKGTIAFLKGQPAFNADGTPRKL